MRRLFIALALLVIAAAFGPRPFGVAEEAAVQPLGGMAVADLSRGAAFAFEAPSGSVYDVWLFPAEESPVSARAELWQDGALVAEGEGGMPALSLRLTAGARYELRLFGEGRARVELARHALSRCFGMPMLLDAQGDAYSKAFAREGDAHWYAVDADSDLPMALVAVPAEAGMRLGALLFDGEGRLLAEGARTAGGACLIDLKPEAGKRYCVRLTAEDGATGLYSLRLARLAIQALPDRVTLSPNALSLRGRESAQLRAAVSPEGTGGILYWESSDPSVAWVDAAGLVTGREPGEATITGYAAGGESDRCQVSVGYVPVSGVSLLSRRVRMSVGDDAAVECQVEPANASDPTLLYAVAPEGVVTVDSKGVLRAVAEGAATVTVRSRDGHYADALTVSVGPAPRRFRALLVGEQNYAATVAAVRMGSVHSVSGVRSMLQNLSFEGARFQVTTLLDASRDAALAGIRDAFSEAADGDLSLFYITCHGYYAGGMTCFQMYDGSVLTAAELAAALRDVKGEVLALIDCCGSGGVLGRASGTGDLLKGVSAVFDGVMGPAPLATSRFHVLASAALEQDSYRLSFSDAAGESDMATVFARALCEAGGWNLDRAARAALRADMNFDGRVTLSELHAYCARRVMWYLNLTASLTGEAYAQTVQAWPEGDATVVFER